MEAFGATDEELNYNEEIENIVNFGIGKFMALHIANSK